MIQNEIMPFLVINGLKVLGISIMNIWQFINQLERKVRNELYRDIRPEENS